MNSTSNWDVCLPTHEQKLLLRASLLQGDDALTAWHQWRATVDIECLDPESFHLLGLLYRNLSIHKVNDSHMKRLKGIYRSKWYANQLLFQKIIAILRSFQSAGIETLVFNDVAIVSHYYQDYGLRPIVSLNVLIHPVDTSATVSFLEKLGWIAKIKRLDKFAAVSSAITFRSESRQPLVLHRRLSWQGFSDYTNNALWRRAILTQIDDFPTCIFSPTDQLLHICFQGFQSNSILRICWIADAMMMINSSNVEIDWNRLVRQAQHYRLVLPLKNMLTTLNQILGAAIPVSILQDIQAVPVSQIEHFEHQIHRKPLPVANSFLVKAFRCLK